MAIARISILLVSLFSLRLAIKADITVFNFFFLPLIYFFYPETRNLTLEQVDRLFTGEKVQLHWHASMGAVGDASERVDEKTGKETVEHVE